MAIIYITFNINGKCHQIVSNSPFPSDNDIKNHPKELMEDSRLEDHVYNQISSYTKINGYEGIISDVQYKASINEKEK